MQKKIKYTFLFHLFSVGFIRQKGNEEINNAHLRRCSVLKKQKDIPLEQICLTGASKFKFLVYGDGN